MIIAVASEGSMVTGHFGHCEGFHIFTVRDNQIVKDEFVKNPGHKPGFLPVFLAELGTEVIVAGGMGAGAQDIFNQKGIKVVTGATGQAREAAQGVADGTLQSTQSVCHEHQHEHEHHHGH